MPSYDFEVDLEALVKAAQGSAEAVQLMKDKDVEDVVPGESSCGSDVVWAAVEEHASTFVSVSDGLAAVSTSGWTGRAADRFRERFDVEPRRWRQAGEGFTRAAQALDGYAAVLTRTQQVAAWARTEWARGETVTQAARTAYDADVARGRSEQAAWESANGPGSYVLTVEPFVDPGEAIRSHARTRFDEAVSELEAAAHVCADGVRAGCADAPAKRNWLERPARGRRPRPVEHARRREGRPVRHRQPPSRAEGLAGLR